MSQVNLMFHDVKLKPSRWNTEPRRFEDLMKQITEHKNIKNITITIDDAGKGNYEYMLPLFEKFQLKAHIFVPTHFIASEGEKSPYMTSSQICEFSKLGHIVGSHSHTHPKNISLLSVKEIEEEWLKSKEILEDITGKKVETCSIPGGFYSKAQLGIIKELGYGTIFNSVPTYDSLYQDDLELRGRFSIERKTSDKVFQSILSEGFWIQQKFYYRQKLSQTIHTLRHKLQT
jgi:peptidoglycan/xylan/chitin deacetylase (PgdA/CDA1 family)